MIYIYLFYLQVSENIFLSIKKTFNLCNSKILEARKNVDENNSKILNQNIKFTNENTKNKNTTTISMDISTIYDAYTTTTTTINDDNNSKNNNDMVIDVTNGTKNDTKNEIRKKCAEYAMKLIQNKSNKKDECFEYVIEKSLNLLSLNLNVIVVDDCKREWQ